MGFIEVYQYIFYIIFFERVQMEYVDNEAVGNENSKLNELVSIEKEQRIKLMRVTIVSVIKLNVASQDKYLDWFFDSLMSSLLFFVSFSFFVNYLPLKEYLPKYTINTNKTRLYKSSINTIWTRM